MAKQSEIGKNEPVEPDLRCETRINAFSGAIRALDEVFVGLAQKRAQKQNIEVVFTVLKIKKKHRGICHNGLLLSALLFLLIGCVKEPTLLSGNETALSKELAQIDATLKENRIQRYTRIKTLLRMAATINHSTSQLRSTGEIVRKIPELIRNPSLDAIMQDPLLWFEALSEWNAMYKTTTAGREDEFPPLLKSCGESDFWTEYTGLEWTSSWEHLLLAMAWELGEDRDLLLQELILVNAEELGNNEFSVLGCWVAATKFNGLGYPAVANTYYTAAQAIITDATFDPTEKLKVSWMGTARQDVRATMLEVNTLLQLSSADLLASPFATAAGYQKMASMLRQANPQRLSEFHIIADYFLHQNLKGYKRVSNAPVPGPHPQPSVSSQVLLGAYLGSWTWEQFLGKHILPGHENIHHEVFTLMNVMGDLGQTTLD